MLRNVLSKFKRRSATTVINASPFIRDVSKFVVNECVVGDYYEFGVYRGHTLVSFYTVLQRVAKKRIARTDQTAETQAYKARQKLLSETRFHAFDSFQGLPALSGEDKESRDFAEGQYSSSEESLISLAKEAGMAPGSLVTHPGWFSDTCHEGYVIQHGLSKAAIIWLDCDLYSSARDALNIFHSILQDGTVIVIDDWFNFRGHPQKGVQKAWGEFVASPKIKNVFEFSEYKVDGWSRKSFICNEVL